MRDANLADIIRRDLDQLPLLPDDRWLPARRSRALGSTSGSRARVIAAAGLIVVMLLAGLQAADRLRNPSTPTVSALSRQQVIARIRSQIDSMQYVEAKLVPAEQLHEVRPDLAIPGAAANSWWVISVTNGGRDTKALGGPATHVGLYVLDVREGSIITQSPGVLGLRGFESLTDIRLGPDRTSVLAVVVEAQGSDRLRVQTIASDGAPGMVLDLRGDEDTMYALSAGLGSLNSDFLELVRGQYLVSGSVVRVTFDAAERSDGSHRLEALRANELAK